ANDNSNAVIVQANSLTGANASKAYCPLSIQDIQYVVGVTGSIILEWVSTVAANTPILVFGSPYNSTGVYTGEFNAARTALITNNANTPSGDINLKTV